MSTSCLSRFVAAGQSAGRPIALRGSKILEFAQFAAAVAAIAAQLRRRKVRRVAVSCGDSYAFAVGLFGALQAGSEVVIPPNTHAVFLESIRGEFDDLVDDDYVDHAESSQYPFGPLDGDRSAVTFFTSGSTGKPKRITRTLGMLDREVELLNALWGAQLGPGPVHATVPHQHVYGLTFKVLWPLVAGCAFVAETDDMWEKLLQALRPAATLVCSPAHLCRMGGLMPLPAGQRPRRVFSAGALLPYGAAVEAERILGVRPTEIFGSTETGAIATRMQDREDEPWHLLPGLAMRCDESGRLCLLSPHGGSDWIQTADIVKPVAGGFRLLGRADRIVKIEGRRVSLTEVEHALLRLPWISGAAAAVSGEPGRLGAAVVLSAAGLERLGSLGRFRLGRMLRSELAKTLDPAAVPRLWRYVGELPSAPMGKRRDTDIVGLFEVQP